MTNYLIHSFQRELIALSQIWDLDISPTGWTEHQYCTSLTWPLRPPACWTLIASIQGSRIVYRRVSWPKINTNPIRFVLKANKKTPDSVHLLPSWWWGRGHDLWAGNNRSRSPEACAMSLWATWDDAGSAVPEEDEGRRRRWPWVRGGLKECAPF